jgi:hypothetical protein
MKTKTDEVAKQLGELSASPNKQTEGRVAPSELCPKIQQELFRILSVPRDQRPNVQFRWIKPLGSYKNQLI